MEVPVLLGPHEHAAVSVRLGADAKVRLPRARAALMDAARAVSLPLR